VIGQIYATINIVALVLQLGCGLILRYVGVPITLLALPVILGATVLVGMVSPRFLTTAIAKVVSKAFDYSLFRAAKEILYIPLTTDEKTRGKAVVDIFGYRVAKAGASLLILVVLGAGAYGVGPAILVCAVIWFALTRLLVKKHVKLTVDTSDAPR
jgi:AAA family ATP:ADP antiporter